MNFPKEGGDLVASELNKRIWVSVSWFLIIALFIWIKQIFLVVITVLSVMGVHEFYRMTENKGIYPFYYMGLSVAAFIPMSLYFGLELNRDWQLFLVIAGLIILFLLQIRREENDGATAGIAISIFGIFYISWTLTFLLRLRLLPEGVGLSAMTIVATKVCDILAYLVGSRFGSHPFMPKVSPKKTWEGFWAGLFGAVVSSEIFSFFIVSINAKDALILGILIGVFGQLGDISESLIKRDCQVKDSSSVFPGMGGVLDIVDSLLFTSPIAYFYVTRMIGL